MPKTVVKNVKQLSETLSAEQMTEISLILKRYNTVRTYVFSLFGSINGLQYLQYPRTIRDEWVHSGFAEQWGLPPKYWKCALEDAFNSIKSNWEAAKVKIRKSIYRNENLTEQERLYCFYALKANSILHAILTHQSFVAPDKLKVLEVNEKKTHALLCRYVRKYKLGKPSGSHGKSLLIDMNMYSYKTKNTDMGIQGLKHGKQIKFNTKDKRKWSGNLNIVVRDNHLEIHKATKVKVKSLSKDSKQDSIVGIDKGFCTLIATSTAEDKQYGLEFNTLLKAKSDQLSNKNKQRNKLNALLKKHQANNHTKKVKNILKFNLGKKKYIAIKHKQTAHIESYVNNSLNKFIREQNPSEIVSEDLTFTSWKHKLPKRTNRYLSSWIKGYLQERIEYKASLFSIKTVVVNPAYTSQICHRCDRLGNRNGGVFKCDNCSMVVNADYNAARNIRSRKDDNEISLYTPYKRVKKIIQRRVSALVGSENDSSCSPPNQAGLETLINKSLQERIRHKPTNNCI